MKQATLTLYHSESDGILLLNGWYGRTEIPVKVIGETPKKYRIKLTRLTKLPGRNRWGQVGDVVLVPKYAIRMKKDKI